MIKDLLPAYYEAHGVDPSYTALRIIAIDGHEVAWMEFTRTTDPDKTYKGRALYCECDFTEGVGWKRENGKVYDLHLKAEKCLYRKTALHLRHLELREEYLKRFNVASGDSFALRRRLEEIISDLIEKVKAGEFVEDGNGARFWGGYFYLQTVALITDQFFGHLWEDVRRLWLEKKIGLEGAVIQPYREPPPPVWEEYLRIEVEGWVGIAYLAGHHPIAKEWRLEVLKPDGMRAYRFIPGLALLHDPVFGPDPEDVDRARKELRELIYKSKIKN